jgi:hypothetical protein
MTFCNLVSIHVQPFSCRYCCTYGHHSTRAAASNEDLAGVTLVLVESVGNHVGDRVAVSTTAVGEGGLGRDIPASALVGGLGVDDDEAVLVGELCVGRTSVVGLGSTRAVVNGNDDRRLSSKLVRDVDVHLGLQCGSVLFRYCNRIDRTDVRWVASIVGHLLQRCSKSAARKGDDGCQKRELHIGQSFEGLV